MTNASDLISQDRKAKIEMSFLSKILFYHISVHNTVKIIYNLIWLTSHYIIDYIIDLKFSEQWILAPDWGDKLS